MKYVVFSQDENGVGQVIGPFSSYKQASSYVKYTTTFNPDNDYWYGVRKLEPPITNFKNS